MMEIPLMKPYKDQRTEDNVLRVIATGHWTEGAETEDLEDSFKEYTHCKHAIAVTSCTTGLETALRALGIGPGDEVIIPDYTYPATACAVAIVGARPVMVDVHPDTMLIDYGQIENAITERTKAIIPVSLFGNPLNFDHLLHLKAKYGLFLLEDAACALGAEFRSVKAGNLADITVFSLHPRKFITTGEGGMITTNNSDWAAWMKSYKHFGMGRPDARGGMVFERIGTNYKLSNILAAVGLCQFRIIEDLLAQRIELSSNYIDMLKGNPKVNLPLTTENGKHSRQSFCIQIPQRDRVMQQMRQLGIEVQIGTYSLHSQPAFNHTNSRTVGDLGGSKHAFLHCMTLPLHHELTDAHQRYIVEKLYMLLDQ